jgi:alkylated DNA repair protein alkB family protein 6
LLFSTIEIEYRLRVHSWHKINAPNARWTELSHRRLQSHPSALTAKNVLLASPLPDWLQDPVVTKLEALESSSVSGLFGQSPHEKPNHVLINEYHAGQGIMPHEDGPAYWPVVATVSLGSALVLDIYEKDEKGRKIDPPKHRVLQEARRYDDIEYPRSHALINSPVC